MIRLLNEACTTIGDFAGYDDLVDHINKTESSRIKLLNSLNHMLWALHALDQSRWSFIYYKYDFLKTIYSTMKEPPITGIERGALRQGLDLIEVHQGSEGDPLQIPVSRDTDIESLKWDFCLAYCEAHDYTLSETFETSKILEPMKTVDSMDSEERKGTAGGKDDLAV